jgi:LysM repeat protein
MKRIFPLLLAGALCSGFQAQAQDAAVEERLNKLSGQVEDLLAAKAEQDKRIAALVREVENLREQASKPTGNYAGAEDVRKLADAVREVDRKRIEDNERILKSIDSIAKAAAAGSRSQPVRPKDTVSNSGGSRSSSSGNETGYEYVIASGDTLSTIAEAYRAKGVKVSVDQILKANPDLKERSLVVGKKIFIPDPK